MFAKTLAFFPYYDKISKINLDEKRKNMISYIKGKLEAKNIDSVIIDVGGIGYKINMSTNSIDRLGETGAEVKVYTYMRVREDDISLFGFCTNEELKMFEQLLGVSGVGAKSALSILANISPSSFALAIITGDINTLKGLPGIGAKSAQRMILELKDKMKTQEATNPKVVLGLVVLKLDVEAVLDADLHLDGVVHLGRAVVVDDPEVHFLDGV